MPKKKRVPWEHIEAEVLRLEALRVPRQRIAMTFGITSRTILRRLGKRAA